MTVETVREQLHSDRTGGEAQGVGLGAGWYSDFQSRLWSLSTDYRGNGTKIQGGSL